MLLEKKIPLIYVLNKIKYNLLSIIFVGILTSYLTTKYSGLLPEVPISLPAFLGTAISVLLSFKMNQSYDRWWEARKIWGAIVNDSRNLILQLQSFIKEGNTEELKQIAYRQIAFCYTLGNALRNQINPLEDLEMFLNSKDLEILTLHKNKSLGLLTLNMQSIKELKEQRAINVLEQISVNRITSNLCDSLGMAERIKNTIFPATYRYFLFFIIYIFVILLSIALKHVSFIFELVLLISVSIGFFLIEKSAYHLQDPFSNRPSDIPVTSIARTIEINLRQLLGESDLPEPLAAKKFYIM